MRISVKDDLDQLKRNLTRLERDQVPFAASLALNNLATDIANALTAQMDRYLDKPTPFTQKAYQSRQGTFRGKRANKKNLVAIIEAGKIQGEYLKYQIVGGIRKPKQTAILVPTRKAPLNQYGNLTKGRRKNMIAGEKGFFSAGKREDKTPGIYKRIRKSIEPMAFYVDQASYEPIYPIDKIANGVARNRFARRFREALERAVKTAR